MRRMDSDEFRMDFPDGWDTFCDFFGDDAEAVRFLVDEDGLVEARHEGETVGWWESEGAGTWENEKEAA